MTALRSEVAPEWGGYPVPLRRALRALAAGRAIVVDDGIADYVVVAAGHAGATAIAWVVRQTSGFICVALDESRSDELQLPALPRMHARAGVPAFAVAVDAAEGIGTGISATDRARTIRLLADPRTRATDLRRPGHVVPVRVPPGGVLTRLGVAEAALDLVRAAGCAPAAAFAHLVDTVSDLPRITVNEVLEHRRREQPGLHPTECTTTAAGQVALTLSVRELRHAIDTVADDDHVVVHVQLP